MGSARAFSISRNGRRSAEQFDESSGGWLLTLNDLLLLLLTFFVMRFAAGYIPPIDLNSEKPPTSIAQSPGSSGVSVRADYEDLRKELLQIFSAEHSLTGTSTQMQFRDGTSVASAHDKTVLSVATPFIESSPEELTFRAATIVKTAAKISRDRSRTIDLTIIADQKLARDSYSSDWELAELQLRAALRQMIDTGVDPQALFAGVRAVDARSSTTEPSTELATAPRMQIVIRERVN